MFKTCVQMVRTEAKFYTYQCQGKTFIPRTSRVSGERASFLFDKHLFNCKLDDSNYVSFFEILETTIFLNLKKFDDLIYKL